MTEPGRAEVEGTLDLTDKYHHIGDGKTVAGTSDDDKGETETVNLPDEVDPEELTDKQRTAFEIAVKNPNLSARRIDEYIGSDAYASRIFRTRAPEWYESTFKQYGNSDDGRAEGKTKLSVSDVVDAVEALEPTNMGPLSDRLDYSRKTIRDRINQTEEITCETGVDGFHPMAKVYSTAGGGDESDAEAAQEAVSEATPDTVEHSQTGLERVLTVCRYLSRYDSRDGELAEWVVNQLA